MKENSTNKHEVDKAFEEVFENFEAVPSPSVWEAIQQSAATNSGAGIDVPAPSSWLQIIQSVPYLSNVIIGALITGIALVGVYNYQHQVNASNARTFIQNSAFSEMSGKEALKEAIKEAKADTKTSTADINKSEKDTKRTSMEEAKTATSTDINQRDKDTKKASIEEAKTATSTKINQREKETKKASIKEAKTATSTDTNKREKDTKKASIKEAKTASSTDIHQREKDMKRASIEEAKTVSSTDINQREKETKKASIEEAKTVTSTDINKSEKDTKRTSIADTKEDPTKATTKGITAEIKSVNKKELKVKGIVKNMEGRVADVKETSNNATVQASSTNSLITSIQNVIPNQYGSQNTPVQEATLLTTKLSASRVNTPTLNGQTVMSENEQSALQPAPFLNNKNNKREAGAISAAVIRQQMLEKNALKEKIVAPVPVISAMDRQVAPNPKTTPPALSIDEKAAPSSPLLQLPSLNKNWKKIRRRTQRAMQQGRPTRPVRPRLPQQFNIELYGFGGQSSSYNNAVEQTVDIIPSPEILGDTLPFQQVSQFSPLPTWAAGIQGNYTIGIFEFGLGINRGNYRKRFVSPRDIIYVEDHEFFGDFVVTSFNGPRILPLPNILADNNQDIAFGDTIAYTVDRMESFERVTIPLNMRVHHHFGRLGVYAEAGIGLDIFIAERSRNYDHYTIPSISPLKTQVQPFPSILIASGSPDIAFSYQLGVGGMYHIGRNFRLIGGLQFYSPMANPQSAPNYRPYNIGGRLGLAYKFRAWSKK